MFQPDDPHMHDASDTEPADTNLTAARSLVGQHAIATESAVSANDTTAVAHEDRTLADLSGVVDGSRPKQAVGLASGGRKRVRPIGTC